LVVIGIDGGTMDLVLPWVREGRLPHIGRLVHEGSSGELESIIPPLTGPAWVSFMTGVNPGKHGVFDFMKPGLEAVKLINFESIRAPTLWEILSQQGRKQIIVNMPITYPPPKINGALISGILSGTGTISHPPELIGEVEAYLGEKYRTSMSIGPQLGREELYFSEFSKWHELIEKTALYMIPREWDLFLTVFNITDGVSHFLWRHMEQGGEFSDGIYRAYALVDRSIGRILEHIDPSDHVILLSDHGFGPLRKNVNLNLYFMEKGLLQIRRRSYPKKFLFMRGFTPNNLYGVAKRFRLTARTRSLPIEMRYKLLDSFLSFRDVDWERTLAYSRGHIGQIYINRPVVERRGLEYYQFRDQLIDLLYDLKHRGEKIVDRVYTQEEVYWGEYLDSAPDLFIVMKNFAYLAYPLLTSDNKIVTDYKVESRSGTHRLNGMFVAKGTRFPAGRSVEDARILDIAPTILDILDVPIPENMDGKSLASRPSPAPGDQTSAAGEDREDGG
jgi:predicted AlkP superfamily phosphohydrolase/phosphomutase